MLDIDQLAAIAGRPANDNMRSILLGLEAYGQAAGLDLPHRLAQYLGQLAHEMGGFLWDEEIWGPTAAQRRYDTRTDLGNSAAADGDGYRYRGRTGMHITGKANTRAFRDWCRAEIDPAAPDFVADPDLMNTDPWEGLGPVWYWQSRDLNRYADQGDTEMVTRRINGGLNGYSDRLTRYTRAALVLLGYGPEAVRLFQDDAGLAVDGIAGPKTRAALHAALVAAGAGAPPAASRSDTLAAALAQIRDTASRALAGA
ncbi:peptidoglycan-binding protein [Salipiger abyssi]|uniref:peptidoglycan-binding protein n=1 Tax=Salipiger abyssi TaxID=1250539 RepID=UPI0040587A7A